MGEVTPIAAGVRVVEIGSSAAVASAGMVLADAGAHVTIVEPPGGSPLRALPAFALWARGKHSRVIDLASDPGQGEITRLVANADVVLVGLKPASVERLRVGYDRLSAQAPQLVYGALSGFGQDGPYRDIPVYDAVMQARGGRMFEFGMLFDGERPGYSAAPVVAHGASMALLLGVLGALRARQRNGGVGREDTLNFGGIHIVAAGQDHVFLAVHDVNAAIFIHGAQVAGMQPTVRLQSFAGFLLITEIAQHHDWAALHKLAHLTARHGFGGIFSIRNPQFAVGNRASNRAVLIGAVERMG